MSYAVSITQDGTRLETAGKYVDQDIVVGISDSIKKAAQTYNPSTTDQVIPAGKYLSGAQTIKGVSGTKSITANGTYDVTGFASAAVSVPAQEANSRVYDVTVTDLHTSDFVLMRSQEIADHFNDPNLTVEVLAQQDVATTTVNTCCFAMARNGILFNTSSSIAIVRGSGDIGISNIATNLNEQKTNSGHIYVTSSGDLHYVAGSYRVRAGTYKVRVSW